jgi:hypothetical protein
MVTESPDGDVKALWQRQEEQAPQLTATGVRRRAEEIEAKARRRRLVFWVSIVNNVAICAALAWVMPQTRPFVAVFFLAVSLAQIQALTRGSRTMAPADAGLMTCVAFLRASLEREREFSARAWLWFLVPAGIGELSLIAGMLATGVPAVRAVLPLGAGIVALFLFVFLRSADRARRLRIEIDVLRDARGGEAL